MTFENIPGGTIYRVKVKGTNDRIFAYKMVLFVGIKHEKHWKK